MDEAFARFKRGMDLVLSLPSAEGFKNHALFTIPLEGQFNIIMNTAAQQAITRRRGFFEPLLQELDNTNKDPTEILALWTSPNSMFAHPDFEQVHAALDGVDGDTIVKIISYIHYFLDLVMELTEVAAKNYEEANSAGGPAAAASSDTDAGTQAPGGASVESGEEAPN